MMTGSEIRKLLGREVEVVLVRKDEHRDEVISRGKLMRWSDEGEIVVKDDNDFLHYCWPALEIRPV
jgi:hypothetical protein